MTNVLFIRDLLYRLKQDYGQRMDLYFPGVATQNFNTGSQIVDFRKISIPRVVLLPQTLQNRFIHDVAYVTSGRDFSYGGLFQEGVSDILIDGRDVPKNVKIDTKMHITYNHVRYDIVNIEELEHRCGWAIKMKRLNTLPAVEIMNLRPGSCLQYMEVVHVTVN